MKLLSARAEIEVARSLAGNPAAPIDRTSFDRMAQRARTDQPLARALCARAREPASIAALFLAASQIQRKAIIQDARRADLGQQRPFVPSESIRLLVQELEQAAAGMDRIAIEAVVARVTGASPEIARAIVTDPHGDPLALVLAMLNFAPNTATRIFVAVGGPIVTTERLQALTNLVADVPPLTAARLVHLMVGTPMRHVPGPAGMGGHVPVVDPQAKSLPSRPALSGQGEPAATPASPRKVIFLRRA